MVTERNNVEILLQQLKGALKRLGGALGQPHDHFLEEQSQTVAEHVTEHDADLGPAARLDRVDAQQSTGCEGHKSDQNCPGEQSRGREQGCHLETPLSMYQRVRGMRDEEGRLIWRARTTYPGFKGCPWLSFESEVEAAQASDVPLMRFALAHKDKLLELVGQLNFTLGHYISSGTAEEERLAVALLEYMLRLPRLSARNRQRVVEAYAALCAKRDTARRGGRLAEDPYFCSIVHPENGVAASLAKLSAQAGSDLSSGTSDLPEGVVGAAETLRAECSPKRAELDVEQEQTQQQVPATGLVEEGAAPMDASSGPSMPRDMHNTCEQQAQEEGGQLRSAGLEVDRDPYDSASGRSEEGVSTAQEVTGSHRNDGPPCAAQTQPCRPLREHVTVLEELPRAAHAPAAMLSRQQSSCQHEAAAAEPINGMSPPRPPPSASLLDDSPLWHPGKATSVAHHREEGGLEDAASGQSAPVEPPEPSSGSGQPATSRSRSTSSASATSSSNNTELAALAGDEAALRSQLRSRWGARNGHVRGGRGKGTEADPVVLSSDSEDEAKEDEEQVAKRPRTEGIPAPSVVKPEMPVPRKQPTLAELLQQYRDPRRGGQGRPGSLHRPSTPLFESLRRPAPGVSSNGAVHDAAPAGLRQGLPPRARARPHTAASQAHIPGPRPEAAQVSPRYTARQRPAPPAAPGMAHRPFDPLGQHSRHPAAPFVGKPFSAFRQAPAASTAQQQQPWTAQGPHSGRQAQQAPQGGVSWEGRPWQASGAAQGQPPSVEFVDLGSSSGDSEGVSWHQDVTIEAESEPAADTESPSAQAAKQHASCETAHAAAAHNQASIETQPPLPPAVETSDTSGLVIERDRTAMAGVEAKEWELRRVEIERQAEEARREKKRRRAEAQLAVRSQARLEDHRRLLAAQESEADERERLRMEVRAALELRVKYARSAESTLRALHIPLEYDPVTNMPNISKAVRRCLRFYHPDRYQSDGLRAQVEAEEMFKLISRLQNP